MIYYIKKIFVTIASILTLQLFIYYKGVKEALF